MRMRFKPYAHDELMAADFHVHEPLIWGGKWHGQYARPEQPFILELGCGDGTLWTDNLSLLPEDISITLSDISSGMLRDARRAIGSSDTRFAFRAFDCRKIPCKDESFDLVIANHVLFYCDDIPSVLKEVRRVLAPGGRFLCSAYGKAHMQEVSQLVQDFDERIVLSADRLYERF